MLNQKELVVVVPEAQQVSKRGKFLTKIKKDISELVELPFEHPDMRFVIGSLRFAPYNRILSEDGTFTARLYKQNALNQLLPTLFSSYAKINHWQAESPQIKYMVGWLFKTHISKRIKWLQEQIEQLETGDRRFIDEDLAAQRKQMEKEEVRRLQNFDEKLNANLQTFVEYNFNEFADKQQYLEVLQLLLKLTEFIMMDNWIKDRIKLDVYKHLKRGDIKQALAFLQQKLA